MKCKFLFRINSYFSRLANTFFIIVFNFLIGQSVVTDIVRDGKENIISIEYFTTVSKKLALSKLETFHLNGHVSTLESFSSGLKNGEYKEFYNNGNIKIEGQYINGHKHGLWTEYFREGGTMRIFYANENGKNGRINEWYRNGEKKICGEYFQGQKHGLWTAWYSTGVKESIVTYNQGEQEGIFTYFYDNGNKKYEGSILCRGQKKKRCWDIYGNSQICL